MHIPRRYSTFPSNAFFLEAVTHSLVTRKKKNKRFFPSEIGKAVPDRLNTLYIKNFQGSLVQSQGSVYILNLISLLSYKDAQ